MIVVGVDAGATHTRAIAVREDGTLIGTGAAGPANPQNVGPGAAAAEILLVTSEAASGQDPDMVVAGVAGLEDPELQQEVVYALEARQQIRQFRLYSDAVIALEGAFLGGPGIIVIAGTGSVAWGRNARGEHARAGGWGHLIDDAGSGYDIGHQAINAVLRAYDGRGQPTSLTRLLNEALEAETPEHLGAAMRRMDPARVAALARIVVQAADQGDAIARAIVRNAAGELAAAATAVWQKLNLSRGHRVAPLGGVFTHERMRKAVASSLARRCPPAVLISPRLPPVGGAAWKAFVLAGRPPDEAVVEQIEAITRTVDETQDRREGMG